MLYMGFCYYKGLEKEEMETVDDEDELQSESEQELGSVPTRVLVIRTLRNIGCEHLINNSGNIIFTYQGEQFTIIAKNDYLFIDIYDLWWRSLPMDNDIEEFARMKKAVNHVNANSICTVLYTFREEERIIGVHSKMHTLFTAQIPEIEKYMVAILEGFFKAQREVVTEIEKYRKVDEAKING